MKTVFFVVVFFFIFGTMKDKTLPYLKRDMSILVILDELDEPQEQV